MSKVLPPNPNLEFDKKQAKALLKAYRSGDPTAHKRVQDYHPRLQNVAGSSIELDDFKLSDAQLVVACEYGFSSWAKLKHHIELLRDDLNETFNEFARAVGRGKTDQVRKLLESNPALVERINDPVIGFDAPAVVVAAGCNRETLDVLLDFGADINAKSVWWAGGFGVLHGANQKMAEYLIDKGAKVDIHAAAEQGLMDVLRELLEADPSLVDEKGPDGKRPLHFARTTKVVDYLLEKGADLNARDVDHCGTAAQWMVDDRTKLCRYLLEQGAEADIFMACALGDMDLAQSLLDADSDILNKRIGQGDYAPVPQAPGQHIYVYTFGDNKSPHQVAHRYGYLRLYQFLLEHSSPQRQFVAACEQGDTATVHSLLKQFPDLVNSLGNADMRVLADSAWENELQAVQAMLESGFDPHVRSTDDSTPLHQAAFHGFSDVVNLLLQHKPLLEDRNQHGARPLDMAIYGATHSWRQDGDFPETVKALIDAGSTVKADSIPSGNDEVDAILRSHIESNTTTD